MPLALTCTCGVHLEIDDKFAGQIVNRPDCGRAVQVPRTEASGRQTSGLALASIILALVGAFTVIGTVLAVLVGVLALRQAVVQARSLGWSGLRGRRHHNRLDNDRGHNPGRQLFRGVRLDRPTYRCELVWQTRVRRPIGSRAANRGLRHYAAVHKLGRLQIA